MNSPLKQILFILVISFSCGSSLHNHNKTKEWINPHLLFSSDPSIRVANVCFTDTSTIVKLDLSRPQHNFKFVSDTHLLADNGQKYKVVKCLEYPLDNYILAKDKEEVQLTLVFEPLPRPQKSIDLIEGYSKGRLILLGIHDTAKPLKIKHFKVTDRSLNDIRTNYFSSDSVCVKGRFESINKSGKIGMIYLSDVLSDYDYPICVKINEDGSFESKFKVQYPIAHHLNIDRTRIPFFVVPGHTVDITIYSNGYMDYVNENGDFYECSRSFQSPVYDLDLYDYTETRKDIEVMTFPEFGKKVEDIATNGITLVDYIAARYSFTQLDYALAKNTVLINVATKIFDYGRLKKNVNLDSLQRMDLCSPHNYDVLRLLPISDPLLLSSFGYPYLQNRYSFSYPIFNNARLNGNAQAFDHPDYKALVVEDSLLFNSSNPSILANIHILNSLQRILDNDSNEETKTIVFNDVKNTIRDTSFLRKSEMMFQQYTIKEKDFSYELPNNTASESLRKITSNYLGKYVFLDFWATSCKPCRINIEQTEEVRSIYRNSEDVAFVFLTSEDESPQNAYDEYVAKHLKEDNS